MFKNITQQIAELNNSAKTVANCERAKKMRKKLLSIGIPMAVVGFLGAFTCFVLFATAGLSSFGSHGPSARMIVPFCLFLPCGFVGAIGASITAMGMKILVTGYATDLIDEAIGEHCPNCGDIISVGEIFCSKCGTKLQNKCPDCGTVNGHGDSFCRNCGKQL